MLAISLQAKMTRTNLLRDDTAKSALAADAELRGERRSYQSRSQPNWKKPFSLRLLQCW